MSARGLGVVNSDAALHGVPELAGDARTMKGLMDALWYHGPARVLRSRLRKGAVDRRTDGGPSEVGKTLQIRDGA